MALPNFSQLIEIDELLKQIEVLTDKVNKAEEDKNNLKVKYEQLEKIERDRIKAKLTQEKLLGKIQSELKVLQSNEDNLRIQTVTQIQERIDNFFDSNKLKEFIFHLINKIQESSPLQHLIAGSKVKAMIPELQSEPSNNENELKIISDKKTYILDLDTVKDILLKKIITNKLPEAMTADT